MTRTDAVKLWIIYNNFAIRIADRMPDFPVAIFCFNKLQNVLLYKQKVCQDIRIALGTKYYFIACFELKENQRKNAKNTLILA